MYRYSDTDDEKRENVYAVHNRISEVNLIK